MSSQNLGVLTGSKKGMLTELKSNSASTQQSKHFPSVSAFPTQEPTTLWRQAVCGTEQVQSWRGSWQTCETWPQWSVGIWSWPEGRREYYPSKISNNLSFLPRAHRALALTPSPLGITAVSRKRFLSPLYRWGNLDELHEMHVVGRV